MALDKIATLVTASNNPTVTNPDGYYYNKSGPSSGSSGDDDIYIECNPTGADGETIVTEDTSDSNDWSSSFASQFSDGPWLDIFLAIVIGIVIFFELHWDLVLKRSAQSISNEIKILEMQKDSSSINNYANTLQIIRTDNLDISEAEEVTNWIFRKRIKNSLNQISGDFEVLQNQNHFIFFDKKKLEYFYLVPKKRVETKTVAGFFLWTIAVSIILSLISYLFIKKQIQPLKRLGIITRSFGRGIETPNLKPT